VDPVNNPIVGTTVTAAAIDAASTVSCELWYREALSYAPGVSIKQPTVGTTLRVTEQDNAINGVGAEIQVPHRNLLAHTMLMDLVLDGNGGYAEAGSQGGMTTLNVSRWRYTLTDQSPVSDLQSTENILAQKLADRLQFGVDLPDGVFVNDFETASTGAGWYTDPTEDPLQQLPDFDTWQNTLTGITIAQNATINRAGNGLARVHTFSEYLEGVDF
jgi:hypothetical protein